MQNLVKGYSHLAKAKAIEKGASFHIPLSLFLILFLYPILPMLILHSLSLSPGVNRLEGVQCGIPRLLINVLFHWMLQKKKQKKTQL